MKLKIECKNLEGNIAWNVYIKKEERSKIMYAFTLGH